MIQAMGKTHIIAVAGKGGVGKTTTCGMLIDYLCKAGKGPLLVVDADATLTCHCNDMCFSHSFDSSFAWSAGRFAPRGP